MKTKRYVNGYVVNFNILDVTTNKEVIGCKGKKLKEFKSFYEEIILEKF